MSTDYSYLDINIASLESLRPYPQWYRQHGVRLPMQLAMPPMHPMEELDLPLGTILHHISSDETTFGPSTDDFFLQGATKMIYVDHVTQLAEQNGPPRFTNLSATKMSLEYQRKYRRTRPCKNLTAILKDERAVLVENYALLPHLWRYQTSLRRPYFKWRNIYSTMWAKAAELAAITNRPQYIQFRLPTFLPPYAKLKQADQKGEMTLELLKHFNETESLEFLELWKWLGKNRENSLLNLIPQEHYGKINLVFVEGDKWCIVTLGHLDAWRKSETQPKGVLEADQLQRRLLKMTMSLMSTRTEEPVEVPVTAQTNKPAADPIKTTTIEPADGQVITSEVPEQADKSQDTEDDAAVVTSKPIKIVVEESDGKKKTIQLGKRVDWEKLADQNLETPENIETLDLAIQKDLEALDKMAAQRSEVPELNPEHDLKSQSVATAEVKVTWTAKEQTLEDGILNKANQLADEGLISAPEYRRYSAIANAYKKLPDPYGTPGKTLADRIVVDPAKLKLDKKQLVKKTDGIIDKSLTKSSLEDFNSRYVKEVLPADITSMILNLQHAGIGITSYTVEPKVDAFNSYEEHAIQLTPVQGKSSMVHFRLPKVDDDGTFLANNVKYRLRTARRDVPIRKVSPTRVALTSYYSRVFVARSEKQVNNYPGWLTDHIVRLSLDPESKLISNIMISDVFDSTVKLPRVYSIMAQRFRSFQLGDNYFFFDYHSREEQYGSDRVKKAEALGNIVVGANSKRLIVVGNENIFSFMNHDGELEELGTMEQLLGLEGNGPLEVAEIKIFSKVLPVGIALAYQMGLSTLVKNLNIVPRKVPAGERTHLQSHEFALQFEDESWIFSRDNPLVELIMGGFVRFSGSLRNYSSHLFDRQEIYLNLLEQNKLSGRYLRELDLMLELFVDPITREILREMKEPTDFVGLLFRATELLTTDWSPDETDMQYMRLVGYERFAGTAYSELVKAIRVQRSRGSVANAKIDVAPHAVWKAIQEDSAIKVVEESNPVHNMRESEEVTYTGTGGRTGRTMVGKTRLFHQNDLGVISESTKDSADVSITTFMTADPAINSLRGTTDVVDPAEAGAGQMLSSPALLSPAADRDDGKRVNFIAIQHSSGTFAKGYQVSPIRTGYEGVVAHRVSDLFAYTAKQKGKVTALTEKAITVTYEDGSTKSVELGRRFGTVAGTTLPHSVSPALSLGDKFEEGDVISYNDNYFAKDYLNPKQVLIKGGTLVKTAILESSDTLEDSSAISEDVAKLMTTQITTVRNVTVKFDQTVHNVVGTDTVLDADSILCTIEDAITAEGGLFDAETRDTLRLLQANTPRAKQAGKVEKVEVFYNGDIEDLSESLQQLASISDRNRKRLARDLNQPYTSGRVLEGLRIEGKQLQPNHAVIRFYITTEIPAGVGGKGVFGNQMKTVFGRVLSGRNETERGEPLGAFFGQISIEKRIVGSPFIIGTTNSLMMAISKVVAKAYFGT